MGMNSWPNSVPQETNGGIPVNLQDQTTRALDLNFIQQQQSTTMLTNPLVGHRQIVVADQTGFDVGTVVGLFDPSGQFYFGEQVDIVIAQQVTLDSPLDRDWDKATTTVLAATKNMAVAGTGASPQIFQIGPVGAGTGVAVDITRIMGYIQTTGTMDDSKFGDIAGGLTNGVLLRQNNGEINNIWNVKTNGEFGLLAYDTAYTDKAPAGSEGFRFRNTYAGQSKHGVTLRLQPGETLEILIQDDLSGLEVFNVMAQGHIVTD